ncbi:MAG: translation initiation factor IF-2 [bacterium]|nr:translation initiation factor IF-2 [bacterium]
MPIKNFKQNKAETINRPPVVAVMGHVDHGKSTLLDYIRKSNIAEKEQGGITQHIGAYEVEAEHAGKKMKITFLDTPGHEAFSQMRERGAKTADVAVLVVAADDGIKPQTIEAYKAIEASGVPFVVAISKIDKPEAEPERVKAQLAENNIFVESYGGKIPSVEISAKSGAGISELMDIILLLAEMENLEADPLKNASGIVIESNIDPKRGISSTLLILEGTLKKGMYIICGNSIAPVRIFENFKGERLDEASFSSPIRITGFNSLPEIGAKFNAYANKKEAEKAMITVIEKETAETKPTNEALKGKILVPVIIKADTTGSVEAIEKELSKIKREEAIISIARKSAGNINEADAKFASALNSPIVLGFNVETDSSAKDIMERSGSIVFLSGIIYELSDKLAKETDKRILEMPRDEILGKIIVLKTFSRTKNKQVVGGKVESGKIVSGKRFKIIRNDFEIGEGRITGLQQNKTETKTVEEGKELGVMTENKIEIARGDIITVIGN